MKKMPPIFAGRRANTLEEFLTLHFEAGPKRKLARRLWQTLEDTFDVDLARLHPDDTIGALVGEVDSLTLIELIVAVMDVELSTPGTPTARVGDRSLLECTFRELVDSFA